MNEGFYRAFEDKHRGSREVIKDRQSVYLPFIQPLIALYPDSAAIDLGCGRGEWLELLKETGFQAQGVDLDDGMLAVCREYGLNVQTKDAIAGLKECANESQSVVSGFHLAEHLPFEVLQTLASEALRILKPGGILILETPNPENIVVGTSNFYLDPTHKQPIPPLLLTFLAEYAGFAVVKVIRLQGPVDLAAGRQLTIHDVLGGVSPDYAVVAQKFAPVKITQQISDAFKPEYGVTLAQLVGLYEQQTDTRFANTASTADLAMEAANRANDLAQRSIEQSQEFSILAQQAMVKSVYAENALNAIYASSSWRLTAPVRWLGNQIVRLRERGVRGRLRDLIKKICKPMLIRVITYIESRPELRARLTGVAGKPKLYDRIRAIHLRMPSNDSDPVYVEPPDSPFAPTLTSTAATVSARKIQHELKAAITRRKVDQ